MLALFLGQAHTIVPGLFAAFGEQYTMREYIRNMENYYFGKVCAKHPAENGLRLKNRRVCWKCQSEASMRSLKKRKGMCDDNQPD